MRDWFASTKFQLACAAFLAGIAFRVFDQIDAAQWVSFTTWTLGLYFGANVTESFTQAKKADA